MDDFIHIDLFAGMGGFSLGLKQSGLNISKTYFSEIDKYAISVYRRNFPDAEYLGSVESISGRRFKGRKTIITFGFPCQDLSVAGKRKGFDGSRSSLFFEAMRIIKEVRPDIFIFENVKGFFSSNNGKDFTIALQTIADLGLYECQWQLLNTSWFLPQNRERIYFVGSLGTGTRPEIFPIRETDGLYTKKSGQDKQQVCNCIDSNYHKGWLDHGARTMIQVRALTEKRTKKARKIRKENLRVGRDFCPRRDKEITTRADNNSNTITATQSIEQAVMISKPHGFNKGGEKKLPCLRASSMEHNEFVMEKANAVTPDAYLTRGARNRDENGKAVLTSMCDRRIRRLTPTECERLQGFPDNWTKHGHKDQLISDTQRFKMCGNAVSIPTVKIIGEKLK